MSKYIKKFNEHSEYEDFMQTRESMGPNVSYCKFEEEVHYNPKDYSKEYLTFKALEDGTFRFNGAVINYSIDKGTTWKSLEVSQPLNVTAGQKVLWKMSGKTPTSTAGIGRFFATMKFDIEGNIMSIVSGDNFINATTISDYQFKSLFTGCTNLINTKNLVLPLMSVTTYCYYLMFQGCTSLTTAPELPATTLEVGCYEYMFYDCASLTIAPKLIATTLAQSCYYGMFDGCTSLTVAPELPAMTLATNCYRSMFMGCSSLTTAPKLPAMTLADTCYREMFWNCTSLITAPELPATTLVANCYYGMFKNCTSLTTVLTLPATTLIDYCYYAMFNGCTSLTKAPQLPATTLASNCYSWMFNDCSSLNYIEALFTTAPSSSYTSNWVKGVASTGIFVKNSAATWTTTGANGVPSGWTVQTASA